MKRIRMSAILFCALLVLISFNYIYVRSVRLDMLRKIDQMVESECYSDTLEQTWKNRKPLISFSVPLAVLDQIDIQLSTTKACSIAQDYPAYLRACYHLRELVKSLSG